MSKKQVNTERYIEYSLLVPFLVVLWMIDPVSLTLLVQPVRTHYKQENEFSVSIHESYSLFQDPIRKRKRGVREGKRQTDRQKGRGRQGQRQRKKEGGKEEGRKGVREGGRKGVREGGSKGVREGGSRDRGRGKGG